MLPLLRRSALSLACLWAAHSMAAPTANAVTDPFDSAVSSAERPLPLGNPASMPVIKNTPNKEQIPASVNTTPSTDAMASTPTTPATTNSAAANQPVGTDAAASATEPTLPAPAINTWTADMVNSATWTANMGKGQYPAYAKAQILLDRSHSSPGAIDGTSGRNMLKAIAAFELMQGLPIDGLLDADVWSRLMQADTSPVLMTYTLTEEDIKGPYAKTIPHDYAEQAKMKGLYYTSVAEMLGERFHMDQTFLQQLNSGKNFDKVGEQILVADNGPEDTRPLKLLIAHKGASELYGFDENNQMIAAYPATIGSSDTPSPSGDVTIRAIAAKPWYGYNPKNFVQGKNMKPLSLPPGPNNPVGLMWIALSKPSYGIHGTPSPSKIDKSRSHGCVRLTNWDAEALSKRIKVGVPVQFRGTPR